MASLLLLLEPGCPPVCIYQDVELVLTRWLLWHQVQLWAGQRLHTSTHSLPRCRARSRKTSTRRTALDPGRAGGQFGS